MGYPIVDQRNLTKPVRKGIIPGLTRPRRADDEIPGISPHEVLVYRVGGQFVVDDGRKRRDDGQVINAINVSVVNLQQDARVTATFEIDSMDASKFTIRANFTCTVLDAATVVRNGLTDASEAMLAYLHAYQPLFELGLGHPISDVNAVRRETSIHIKAYMTMKPPELAGVSVRFANVQVDTPATIAENEDKKRRAEQDFERKKRAAEQEQELALWDQAAKAKLKLAAQNTQQYLDANQQTHDLERTRELNEQIDGDPLRAMNHAQARGEITAADTMERLLALAQEKDRRAIEAENRQHELMERLDSLDRARRDRELEWERENLVRELDRADRRSEFDQEIEVKDLDWSRQIEMRKIEGKERLVDLKRDVEAKRQAWEREDQIRARDFEQAMTRREAEEFSKRREKDREFALETLREFNKRGLLDNFNPDVRDLMSRIRGDGPSPENNDDPKLAEGEKKPAITDGADLVNDPDDESEEDDANGLAEDDYDA
jgi:hypothetical protein